MENFKHVRGIWKYKLANLLLTFFIFSFSVQAQQVVITGKVSDAKTGEPLSCVRIVAKRSQQKTETNFDGTYKLVLDAKIDSIQVSCLGYATYFDALNTSDKQVIDVQLCPSTAPVPAPIYHRKKKNKVTPEAFLGGILEACTSLYFNCRH